MSTLDETRKALFDKLENLTSTPQDVPQRAYSKHIWLLAAAAATSIMAVVIFAVSHANQQQSHQTSHQKGLFNTIVAGKNNQVEVVNQAEKVNAPQALNSKSQAMAK